MGAQTKATEQTEALSILIGARLTSVMFVMDYLILGFDERGALTSFVWPEIIDSGSKSSFGMERYRDKLCSLIEKTTKSVMSDEYETISIEFENGIEMRIPLRSYEGPGERGILRGPKHYLYVF
jgi:hypothetical protein